jgi:hypothetical protein
MPATDRSVLPETLAWYRDAANWIVGISTGALAGTLAIRDVFAGAGRPVQVAVGLGVLLFVVAIVSGVQFYLWIVTFANQRERRLHLEAESAPVPAPVPVPALAPAPEAGADAAPHAEAIRDARTREDRAEGRFGMWYTSLLWCFHAATIAYGAAAAIFVASPSARPEQWITTQLRQCVPPECRAQLPVAVKMETVSGRSWRLELDASGTPQWHPIEDAPASR